MANGSTGLVRFSVRTGLIGHGAPSVLGVTSLPLVHPTCGDAGGAKWTRKPARRCRAAQVMPHGPIEHLPWVIAWCTGRGAAPDPGASCAADIRYETGPVVARAG